MACCRLRHSAVCCTLSLLFLGRGQAPPRAPRVYSARSASRAAVGLRCRPAGAPDHQRLIKSTDPAQSGAQARQLVAAAAAAATGGRRCGSSQNQPSAAGQSLARPPFSFHAAAPTVAQGAAVRPEQACLVSCRWARSCAPHRTACGFCLGFGRPHNKLCGPPVLLLHIGAKA